MAEYINKEKLKTDFDNKAYYISHGKHNIERGMTLNGINQMIEEQQPADIIERSKIDKAIEEIDDLSCRTGDYSYSGGLEMALEILKRNIGEWL